MNYLYIARFLDVYHVKIGVVDKITDLELDAILNTSHKLDLENIDFLAGSAEQINLMFDYIRIRFGEPHQLIDKTDNIYSFETEGLILMLISQLADSLEIQDLRLYNRKEVFDFKPPPEK